MQSGYAVAASGSTAVIASLDAIEASACSLASVPPLQAKVRSNVTLNECHYDDNGQLVEKPNGCQLPGQVSTH